MTQHRIIFYYQTFTTLKPILVKDTCVTHIHVSSVHFGYNSDGTSYIHLNDYPPNNSRFKQVWDELEQASKLGIKIVLMVGGAGGAYNCLFSNFNLFYLLLQDTIKKYPFISGVDLDVEESVSLDNIKKLITYLDKDFGPEFIISMAPVAYALETDTPGMGGFMYKELFKSAEGQRIDYFNTQFYYDFNSVAYESVIRNGYPPSKIVLGMTSSADIDNTVKIVKTISTQYSDFGGVFDWEYFNAPPGEEKDPYQWALTMKNAINSTKSYLRQLMEYIW